MVECRVLNSSMGSSNDGSGETSLKTKQSC